MLDVNEINNNVQKLIENNYVRIGHLTGNTLNWTSNKLKQHFGEKQNVLSLWDHKKRPNID
jgi:hypothetical protein